SVLDQVTGLGVSRVYRQVMRIWQGQGDYFDYLKLASALVPGGGSLSGVLDGAVEQTARYRGIVSSSERARAALAAARGERGLAELEGAVVNVATPEAEAKLARQIVFYRDAA